MKVLEKVFLRRPRILNELHKYHLVEAMSQTNEVELTAIARYARGAVIAVEVGTYQGVSAGRIAAALDPNGVLFCVDPWSGGTGGVDPCFEICKRHLTRTRTQNRIRIVRGYSRDVAEQLPGKVDFAFIDGDHSWSGIETDWNLIVERMVSSGIVCLHDTAIPPTEPWRKLESSRFYDEVIAKDPRFETIETVHSTRVVRKS